MTAENRRSSTLVPQAPHIRKSPTGAEAPTPVEFGLSSIIGRSEALRGAITLARAVAATRSTVLLVGETGTGKELFARGIHYASPVAAEPFVAVNCAAIPESLLESELFGHERGAFTDARTQKKGLIELAGSGSLFLDEIHHMPYSLQPKLLRVLEERKIRRLGGLEEFRINCRVIAATNVRLEDLVARQEFREDLFYRLAVFRIVLPTLRERPEDIELLAAHFLEIFAREHGRKAKDLPRETLDALREHRWPGNIRELKNVIERACVLAGVGQAVRVEHLMIQQRTARPARAGGGDIRIPSGGRTLADIEHEAVRITLQLTHGNQSEAARLLGISRPTLARKMREAGLGTTAERLAPGRETPGGMEP